MLLHLHGPPYIITIHLHSLRFLPLPMPSFWKLPAICFLFCCSFCFHGVFAADAAAAVNFRSEMEFQLSINEADNNYYQNLEKNMMWETGSGGARRLLGGPGSSPPRCTSKCGGCLPCKPVHVAVPPGARVTTEYYPEAWRCKCGNKLYMP